MVPRAEKLKRVRFTDPERLPLGWQEYPILTPDRYTAVVKGIPYGDVKALEEILDTFHIKKPIVSAFPGNPSPLIYLEALTREYLQASRYTTDQKVILGRRGKVKVLSPEQLRLRQMSNALVLARPIYNRLELDRHSKALFQYHQDHPLFRTPLVMPAHFLQEHGERRLYSCIPASLRNILQAFGVPLDQIPREPEIIRRMLEGSEVTRKGYLHLLNAPGIAKTLDAVALEQLSPAYNIGTLIERIVDRSVAMYEWAGHARALSGIVDTARGVFFVDHDPLDPQPQLLPLADVAQALPGWSYPDNPMRAFVFRQHSVNLTVESELRRMG